MCKCFNFLQLFGYFGLQDSDVHISYEDQQKINKFARLNAKVDDLKDELKVKQNDMKNLEEAVEELSLADDAEKIPYLVGEVFMSLSLDDTLVRGYVSLIFNSFKKIRHICIIIIKARARLKG